MAATPLTEASYNANLLLAVLQKGEEMESQAEFLQFVLASLGAGFASIVAFVCGIVSAVQMVRATDEWDRNRDAWPDARWSILFFVIACLMASAAATLSVVAWYLQN
ncbi:MAG: hypothetical protein A2806_02235 [Candidatus Terrybacteria bacterium RIFCSPHIGHO2_01_FULL_48_17]|uniref:Uncharacterized protein n=1 Tax=Candidatus Terrybacteria bacterium RIFCSPHIGHO2_01_FULL_48_17 TaxID=1802362 RepID=A0A1G2PHN0_9BACT|nr:MAG: hypothetical protein A2806_02235 [Candidatus Terrybacteria bacterium RIFCSPHIGHO2_01_FULL_48_17]OHA53566.1 MAG: hypothetical protein A3A30_00190 [Candidatus Terrybacteria bacterium RIFCSPLOWO2_01_FULL_48_14]